MVENTVIIVDEETCSLDRSGEAYDLHHKKTDLKVFAVVTHENYYLNFLGGSHTSP